MEEEAKESGESGAPEAGGFHAEALLEAWLLKRGFHEVDRRKGAAGLRRIVDREGEEKLVSQKRDYFGCIDVSAMSDDVVWFIQVTTKAGLAKRRKKIAAKRWALRPVQSGAVRVSLFEHRIARSACGKRWVHTWVIEDYRPSWTAAGFVWGFVRAGSYDFFEADLAKEEKPIDEATKAEALRIGALPKEEREAAMKAIAAERKKARRAKKENE